MTDEREPFEGWAILELMGHRRLAGRLTEQTLGGGAFLRIDVPAAEGDAATQFYSPSAVYCITPTTEEIARKIALRSRPEPATRWELEPPKVESAPVWDNDDLDADDVVSIVNDHGY